MPTRRALTAAVAAFLVPFRSGHARGRGVYDIEADTWVGAGWWVNCEEPAVSRSDGAAVVQVRCDTGDLKKVPKRRNAVRLYAELAYRETGVVIGDCGATGHLRKPGSVVVACSVPLPPEPTLPIVIEGSGSQVSAPVLLPGGSLVLETTVEAGDDQRGELELNLADGGSMTLWDWWDPSPMLRVRFLETATQAVVTSTVDGPWRVVIREAFP